MTLYDEWQTLAAELLAYGPETFGQSSPGQPVEILTRAETPGASAIDEPSVVWTGRQVQAISRGYDERRDGPTFAGSDIVVIMAAVGETKPTISDRVTVAGEAYAILAVEPVPHGETTAIYRIGARR